MNHEILGHEDMFAAIIHERLSEEVEVIGRVVALGTDDMAGVPTARSLAKAANRLGEALTGSLGLATGAASAKVVLDLFAGDHGASFYASRLGRAVAWWIGVPSPGEMPPSPLVATVLGVSRQRVQELQRAGRLTFPADVAKEMQRRWPL